jgi:hypothetical protein
MKVLIDENLPRKLASDLTGRESRIVAECGWIGKKNGELLSLAEPLFDVRLTLDKSVPYQQQMSAHAPLNRKYPQSAVKIAAYAD